MNKLQSEQNFSFEQVFMVHAKKKKKKKLSSPIIICRTIFSFFSPHLSLCQLDKEKKKKKKREKKKKKLSRIFMERVWSSQQKKKKENIFFKNKYNKHNSLQYCCDP